MHAHSTYSDRLQPDGVRLLEDRITVGFIRKPIDTTTWDIRTPRERASSAFAVAVWMNQPQRYPVFTGRR